MPGQAGRGEGHAVTAPVVIDGWTLARGDYDGAPLVATRPQTRHRDENTAEIDPAGDMELTVAFSSQGYGGSCSHAPLLPRAVLALLIKDALARGVLTLAEITE